MDKTWLWRKKSSEKIISVNDKVNLSSTDNAGETLGHDKEDEMERSMNDLNQKLSSALSECNAKDELVTKHAKVAEEALAGWEKAEAEAVSFKQDLDEALRQRSFMEERMAHTDAALRECMQQLRFVREEQEQRVNDAVTKTSKQHEKVQRALEEKLADTSKRLAKLSVENNQLNNAVQIKEKSVEDLSRRITQLEADLSASMSKLQAKEKDDASLRYEHRMLQKELEIRNEEGEYNRRSADASHKQHLESVKKIAKLENECQRLRVLVRKRLPGPAAMAQMKNEVELLGKEPGETRRRRMNSPVGGSSMVKDLKQDNSPDSPSKRVNYLIERLYTMEEENKTLKETISKKNDDIQSSRVMCARTASKLSQVEAQLAEFSKGQMGMELARNSPVSHGSFLASISEVDASEDSESWASALISELDNFKNEKPKGSPSSRTVGGSEIGLMDDFVEMEKLAIVCVEKKSFESPHASSDGRDSFFGSLEVLSPSGRTGKELVPVGDSRLSSGGANQEMRAKEVSIGKYPSWLQNILKIILQQTRLTLKSCDEIIEDVKNAMAQINGPEPGEVINSWKRSSLSSPSGPEHIGGLISWKSPNGSPVAYNGRTTQELQSQLNESICKIIELVEGVNRQSSTECNSQRILSEKDGTLSNYRNSVTPSGYTVRLFQWKSSELSEILQQFVHTCTDLLNGAADLEKFARDLTSTFEWIINHCFSLQDVSSMKDTMKKHFEWDEARSENEHVMGINGLYSDADQLQVNDEEKRRLKDELIQMEASKRELEGMLKSATDKIETLMVQLQESETKIAQLEKELETLRRSRDVIEDQIQNEKLLNEDLNSQLMVARAALNDTQHKFSCLEVALEDKSNACQELESTCLELQLQLESLTKKDILKTGTEQEERKLQTGLEITAASEKLAECQETILNLGKQLKALAAPKEAELLDKVISVTPSTVNKKSRSSSLLDKMLADDNDDDEEEDTEGFKSPQMKEIICTNDPRKPPTQSSNNSPSELLKTLEHCIGPKETRYKYEGALAIVPSKKRGGGGGGLLRKLLLRRKKGSSKKLSIPMVA